MLRAHRPYYPPGHLPYYYTPPIIPHVTHTHLHHIEHEQQEIDRLRRQRDQWFTLAKELREDLGKVEKIVVEGKKRVEILEGTIRGRMKWSVAWKEDKSVVLGLYCIGFWFRVVEYGLRGSDGNEL